VGEEKEGKKLTSVGEYIS